jgi:hypothetical protein
MTGALRDEVVRAHTAEEARIDEGWALDTSPTYL